MGSGEDLSPCCRQRGLSAQQATQPHEIHHQGCGEGLEANFLSSHVAGLAQASTEEMGQSSFHRGPKLEKLLDSRRGLFRSGPSQHGLSLGDPEMRYQGIRCFV